MLGYVITYQDKCVYTNLKIDIKNTEDPLKFLKECIYTDDINDITSISKNIFSSGEKFRLLYNDKKYVLVSKQVNIDKYTVTELEFALMNKDRLDILSKMNHFVKEPMNNIISIISLFGDTKLNLEQKEFVTLLNETSFALVSLLNDMCDFIKTSSGNIDISKDHLNLTYIMESIKDIIAYELDVKKIQYRYTVQQGLVHIISDKSKVKQILVYLLKFIMKIVHDCSISIDVVKSTSNPKSMDFDITVIGDTKALSCILDTSSEHINNAAWKISVLLANDLIFFLGGKTGIRYNVIENGSRISFSITHSTSVIDTMDCKVFILSPNIDTRLGLSEIIEKFDTTVFMYNDIREVVRFKYKHNFNIGIIDISESQSSIESSIASVIDDNLKIIVLKTSHQKINSSKFYNVIDKNDNMYHSVSSILDGIFALYTNMYKEIKILVADDIMFNQRMYIHSLNRLGQLNVEITDNGGDCIKNMVNHDYDIVFMDIKIPDLQGTVIMNMIETGAIKSKCKYIVAVISTSNLKDTDIQYYKDLGFSDYLVKPISIMNIKVCLSNYFSSLMTP
jgi:CheY-like chemotaxis protein